MPSILVRDDGPVRVISLNRPEVRNALDHGMRRDLGEALTAAADDSRVRALVLTGQGEAFCAGMDLAELQSMIDRDLSEHMDDSRALSELFWRIYSFPKPIVAAVNGHAIAGGAGLASLCDLVLMSEDARLGYTEARIGFVAALVGVYLVRIAGERTARELLLEARQLTAGQALAKGLVNEVVEAQQVLPEAIERARGLCSNSPYALAATKRLLVETAGLPLREAITQAEELNARARHEGDVDEGIRAFLEKRPPSWATGDDAP